MRSINQCKRVMSFFRTKIKDEYPINFKFYSFTFKVAKVLIFKKGKRIKRTFITVTILLDSRIFEEFTGGEEEGRGREGGKKCVPKPISI